MYLKFQALDISGFYGQVILTFQSGKSFMANSFSLQSKHQIEKARMDYR